jgi:mannitol/fructose-specific phosphotransferase system IIA component (Ntr-type)
MKITDIFGKEHIVERLQSRTKRDVLAELSAVIIHGNPQLRQEVIVHTLLEREKLGSTKIVKRRSIWNIGICASFLIKLNQ